MKIIYHFVACFFATVLFFTSSCYADGLTLGGTRLIYDASKKDASIELTNTSANTYYLVQSWASHFDDKKNKQTPFIITPPLFKLLGKDVGSIRVVYVGTEKNALPNDRESVYLLNIRAIPAVNKNASSSRLIITTENIIKIIYRPAGLTSQDAASAGEKLIFTKGKNKIVIKNPTPYAITLTNMHIGKEKIARPGVIMPFSDLTIPTKTKSISSVTFSTINDFGGMTAVKKATL